LTDVGERPRLLLPHIKLETHIDDVANLIFCDGSAHHIRYSINPTVFFRLGTRADGTMLDGNGH
jgi:hypothetical protein